mmetsp:Transcript_78736/g.132073  ORF Transcript_78736/g.132073 Transcript_78736/m.132073 type:complete len:202 (-) Transcript_78736:2038-2643(-)
MGHRYHHDLPWRHPEWPLTLPVLRQDRNHALNTPKDGTMDDHRSCVVLHAVHTPALAFGLPGGLLLWRHLIRQFEALRQLEVQLDCSALVLPLQGVLQLNINLGAVKCSISRIEKPVLFRLWVLPVSHAFLQRFDDSRGPVIGDCLAVVLELFGQPAECSHGISKPCFSIVPDIDVANELFRIACGQIQVVCEPKDVITVR